MSRLTPFLALSLILPIGCQGGTVPVKDVYPRVQVKASKGIFGASGELIVSSDFNGSIEGFRYNKANGQFELDSLTVLSQPSVTYPALTDFTARGYIPSQQAYWQGFNEWSQIQFTGWNQIAQTVGQYGAPLVAAHIQAQGAVQMVKAVTPALIAQTAGQLFMAKSGASPINASVLWDAISPKLQEAVASQFPQAVPDVPAITKPAEVATTQPA